MKGKINYSRRECLAILKNNGFVYDHSSGGHDCYIRNGIKIFIPSNKINAMLFRRLMKENNMYEIY